MDSSFPDDFFDWRLIATFYSALHYINAIISDYKLHVPNDHKQRRRFLDPDGENKLGMEVIPFEAYIELYDYSFKARYTSYSTDISGYKLVLVKVDYRQAVNDLSIVKEFVQKKGLKIS